MKHLFSPLFKEKNERSHRKEMMSSNRTQGNSLKLSLRVSLGIRKGLFSRRFQEVPLESDHSTKMPEFKKYLDSAFKNTVLFLTRPVRSQDSMILPRLL